LSRTFTLSPNDSGSIVYFAEQHGNAATAAARLSTGGLTTRAPRGAEGHEPARFQGRGRSLADDSESAKLPSISLGARWAEIIGLAPPIPSNRARRSAAISFIYRARLKAYQPSVVSPEM
jgi:hypothetical protein